MDTEHAEIMDYLEAISNGLPAKRKEQYDDFNFTGYTAG